MLTKAGTALLERAAVADVEDKHVRLLAVGLSPSPARAYREGVTFDSDDSDVALWLGPNGCVVYGIEVLSTGRAYEVEPNVELLPGDSITVTIVAHV